MALDLLQLASVCDGNYIVTLVSVSSLLIIYYGYKLYHSDYHLKHLLLALIGLNVWNIILTVNSPQLILNYKLLKPSIAKDLVYCTIFVISLLLIHALAMGILRLIDYINTVQVSDVEKLAHSEDFPSPVKMKTSTSKSVSFNKHLVVYDGDSIYTAPLVPKIYNFHYQKSRLFVFILVLLCSIIFYPQSCLLNSTSYILNNSFFTFKFDQIYFSLILSFIIDSVISLVRFVKYYELFQGGSFSLLSIITRFIWTYLSLVLIGALCFLIGINDVLINVLLKNSSSSLTVIFISYFNHAMSDDDFVKSFATIYLALTDCWSVLTDLCFIVFPFLIWFILNVKLSHLS